MRKIIIEVDETGLPEHTDEDFEEWVKYCVGYYGGIKTENPLGDHELEAEHVSIEL